MAMMPSWVSSVARGLAAAACFTGLLALSIEAGAGGAKSFKDAAIRSGEELFRTNCAACHGTEARGDGPLAKLLERQPSDLTMISKKNDGVFPFLLVIGVIYGREDLLGHGPREMPIWGKLFRDEENPVVAHGRIFEITLFIESIQAK